MSDDGTRPTKKEPTRLVLAILPKRAAGTDTGALHSVRFRAQSPSSLQEASCTYECTRCTDASGPTTPSNALLSG